MTGKLSEFCKHGTIVHIDIDNAEINKNKVVRLPILSDVKYALGRVNTMLETAGYEAKFQRLQPLPEWRAPDRALEGTLPVHFQDTEDAIQPQYVFDSLWEMTKGEAIITTGVGQHQMWAAQFYDFDKPRTLITSAGLGHGVRLSFRDRREDSAPGKGGG